LKVRTVSLLLLLTLALFFAVGAYQIYDSWSQHRGKHGPDGGAPLGLPDLAPHVKQQIKLGTCS